MLKGAHRRFEAQRDLSLLAGWTAAMLERSKEIPDFSEVTGWFRPKAEEKPMSNDELIRSMRQWVVVTGGTLSDPDLAAAAGVGVTPKDEPA